MLSSCCLVIQLIIEIGNLELIYINQLVHRFGIYVTESDVLVVNRITSAPISVLCYDVDKGQ